MTPDPYSAGLRSAIWALAAGLLSGCTGSVPVKLELPVNRMELPERTAGVVSLGVGAGEGTYLTLTPDQSAEAPDPENPEVGRCPPTESGSGFPFENSDCNGGAFLRGDTRLGDRLQIGLRQSGDELLSGQAKLYLYGPEAGQATAGDVSLAVTGAYGRDRQATRTSNSDGPVSTDLDRSLTDFGLIAGYRWSSWLMSYGGPYYNRSRYRGEHSRTVTQESGSGGGGLLLPGGGGGQQERVVQPLNGEAEMLGLNVGLRAHLGSERISSLFECARARVDSAETRAYMNRCALGLEISFLGRR